MADVMLAVVAVVLTWVVIDDLRTFKIRNLSVAVLLGAFVLGQLSTGHLAALRPHVEFAAGCFLVLVPLFAAGAIGGGDAKLLGAALLWVGPEGCLVYALLLLPCTVAYLLGARFAHWPTQHRGARLAIPFGPSIAMAWLAFLAVTVWLGP